MNLLKIWSEGAFVAMFRAPTHILFSLLAYSYCIFLSKSAGMMCNASVTSGSMIVGMTVSSILRNRLFGKISIKNAALSSYPLDDITQRQTRIALKS